MVLHIISLLIGDNISLYTTVMFLTYCHTNTTYLQVKLYIYTCTYIQARLRSKQGPELEKKLGPL